MKTAKRYFYGFEYWDGENTTTGHPNTDGGWYNGRLSTAGDLKLFSTKKERDDWTDGYKKCSVTAREARYLCRGMEKYRYDEHLKYLQMVI